MAAGFDVAKTRLVRFLTEHPAPFRGEPQDGREWGNRALLRTAAMNLLVATLKKL